MRTLLLVDDAISIRELLGKAIERHGMTVIKAGSGVQAVQKYKENRPDFVFLDIKLPDLNGINVFEQIRAVDSAAKIYFITGNDNEHFRTKARELGATGYLVKPVKIDELLEILGVA